MKRSLLELNRPPTRSVLAAASRSLHFSRSANFCPWLPRTNRELSRGYVTLRQKEPLSGGLSIFQSASPSPKLFDLANYSAEFLAPERSNSLLKRGRTVHHIDMPKV